LLSQLALVEIPTPPPNLLALVDIQTAVTPNTTIAVTPT